MIYAFNDQGPSTFLSYVVRTAGERRRSWERRARHCERWIRSFADPAAKPGRNCEPVAFGIFPALPVLSDWEFCGARVALAMIGLYGLISYTVQQRTREIGIRVALAQKAGIFFRWCWGKACARRWWALRGCAYGPGSDAAVASVLYGVEPGGLDYVHGRGDVVADSGGGGVSVPARRAMKVDPIVACDTSDGDGLWEPGVE